MKKSVEQKLLEYLQSNHGVFAAGDLQRMSWTNANGSLAVPKSVSRRLQELAAEGKIHAQEINGHTHYSADYIPPKVKPEYKLVENEKGERVALLIN